MLFLRHLHRQYQLAGLTFYYIFTSPSQHGRTVSYSTSLAIFWRHTPCSGRIGRAAPDYAKMHSMDEFIKFS